MTEVFITPQMVCHYLESKGWRYRGDWQGRIHYYEHEEANRDIKVPVCLKFKNFQEKMDDCLMHIAAVCDTTIDNIRSEILHADAQRKKLKGKARRVSQTERDEQGKRIPAKAVSEPFTVDQVIALLPPYESLPEDRTGHFVRPDWIIKYLYAHPGWRFKESLPDAFVFACTIGPAPKVVVPINSQDESYPRMLKECLRTLAHMKNWTSEKVKYAILNFINGQPLEAEPIATNLLDLTPQMVDRYLCSLGWGKVDICRHITEDKPVDIVYEKDGREDHLYLPSDITDKEYGYGLKLCLTRLAECEGINVDQLRIQIGLHWFKTQQDKSINNDDADVTFEMYLDRCYRARKRDREMFVNGTEEDREEEEAEEAAAHGTTKTTEAKLKAVVDEIIEKQIEPNVQRDERGCFVKGNTVHAKSSGIRAEDIRRHRTLINSYLPRILDMLYYEATERNNVQVMMWLADKIIPNSKPATFTDVASVAKIKTMSELRDQSAHTINETLKGDATLEEAKQLMDLYGNHKSLIEASDIEAKLEPMAQLLAERFGKK